MATTPEAKVKLTIHRIMSASGSYAVNYIGGQYANNGTSDILACIAGRFFSIEAKAGKGRPTALQVKALMAVEAAGGVALVINEDNMMHLVRCLENPHAEGLSNYRPFITPAVQAALEGGAADGKNPREKTARIRAED